MINQKHAKQDAELQKPIGENHGKYTGEMHTPFGKLLMTKFFGKLFLIITLVCLIFSAYMNSRAFEILTGSAMPSLVIGVLYVTFGILSVMQDSIMHKCRNRKFEMCMGFITCFFIYDFLILLVWEILKTIFSAAGMLNAAGTFISDAAAVLTVALGYQHAKQLRCTSYSIDIGLHQPCRIALLSDIHLGAYVGAAHVRKIVDMVNRLNGDAVVICGDLIDVNNHILADKKVLDEISSIFREMNSREGVYVVLGNHDPKADNESFQEFLKDSHIQLLDNRAVRLSCFNLVGRTNAAHNLRQPIEFFSGKIDQAVPTVVLDHDPNSIPEAVSFGADLVLCGHTHVLPSNHLHQNGKWETLLLWLREVS